MATGSSPRKCSIVRGTRRHCCSTSMASGGVALIVCVYTGGGATVYLWPLHWFIYANPRFLFFLLIANYFGKADFYCPRILFCEKLFYRNRSMKASQRDNHFPVIDYFKLYG